MILNPGVCSIYTYHLQHPDGNGGGMVINEPIKAGSLGHGTAVPGHFDLDIVVYSISEWAVNSSSKLGHRRDKQDL